jgi:RNA polymerase sigma-70 factor (ECF subfamily)
MSLTPEREDAALVTQETFAAAFGALSRFDRERPFAAWIKRIALNKCRDWARRRAVRRFFFAAESIDASPDLAAAAEPGDERLEQSLSRLERAIAALPASLKEPLLLTAISGMSHQEAASLLNLTPKAVETRVYRAKAALAKALKDE